MQTNVLEAIDDPSLRAYVVWVAILPEDGLDAARGAQSLVTDNRASHFWDAERSLPPLFAPLLGLPQGWPAWDVYLAYGPGATWDEAPPRPAFWQHQLGDAVGAPVLNGARFVEDVRALLATR